MPPVVPPPPPPVSPIDQATKDNPPSLAEIVTQALGDHEHVYVPGWDEQGRDYGMAVHLHRGTTMVVREEGWVYVEGLALSTYSTPVSWTMGYDPQQRRWSVFIHVCDTLGPYEMGGGGGLQYLSEVDPDKMAGLKSWMLGYRHAWRPQSED